MSEPGAGGRRGHQGHQADLLELACRVAVAAGRLLIGSGGRPEVVATKSSPTDVVTEADRAAEALIRDLIGDARPGDRILGEEGGETGSGPGVRWIVDPLDGTVNYLYGLPDWAVSVAAEVDGIVVAGAVFVPRRDELFSASAARSASVTTSVGLDLVATTSGRPPLPISSRPAATATRQASSSRSAW